MNQKDVSEVAGYDRIHDLYFGLLYQLLYPKKLEMQKQLFIEGMQQENVSKESINRILEKVNGASL